MENRMKKNNRNGLAYLRHPNSHSNDETVLLQATAHANHTIYNDIIGQMDPDQTEYIQKMIQRASRHESKNAKSKPVLHERVKSHADIVRSPMASIHREHNESQLSVKRKVETEVPPSIKAAAKQLSGGKPEKGEMREIQPSKAKSEFIEHLDDYIALLASPVPAERRTVIKDSHHDKKPAPDNKYFSEQEHNQRLLSKLSSMNENLLEETVYLKGKLRKLKMKASNRLSQLMNENKYLSEELERQDTEIFQLQELFHEVKTKLGGMEKKRAFNPPNFEKRSYLTGYSKNQFNGASTTEQTEEEWRGEEASRKSRPKSIGKHYRSSQERRVRSNLADICRNKDFCRTFQGNSDKEGGRLPDSDSDDSFFM